MKLDVTAVGIQYDVSPRNDHEKDKKKLKEKIGITRINFIGLNERRFVKCFLQYCALMDNSIITQN